MMGTRLACLVAIAALLVAATPVAAPALAAAGAPAPLLGMDAGSAAALKDAGAPPAFASYWVGLWMESSGWGHFDSALQKAKAAGATPVVYWYYWGDSISPACVDHGCDGRSRAHWDAMTATLVEHLRSQMQGAPVVVVLENEFNKNGITSTTYAPTFDAYLAAQATKLGAVDGVKVVLGYGGWGESDWARFPKAIAASDAIGFQIMRASTKDSEAGYRGASDRIASLVAKANEIAPTKGSFLYDVALSSYPDATYAKIQNETLAALLGRWDEMSQKGLQGIVYRELTDNPSMGTHNYYGVAEQYWGFRTTSGAWKPAWHTWKAAAGVVTPPPPPPSGTPLPANLEGESMTPTTGGRESDASASGRAVWNLWTNGELSQVVQGDGAYTVTVVARGSPAGGVLPKMILKADGATVASWDVASGTLGAYTATATLGNGTKLAVAFANDALTATEDRNLYVDVVRVARPAPNAAPTASFVVSANGLEVAADASASSDPDGDALAYAWDLGDGTTASGPRVTHAYAAAGAYTVKLTVHDGRAAASAQQAVTANRAPGAAFDAAGRDLSWTFDASRSTDPDGQSLEYAWDLGDGATATGPTVSHTYASPGARTVAVRVTDPMGATSTASQVVDARQPNRAPAASVAVRGADLAWSFDAAASSDPDGDALAFAWDFGDGTTASGAQASHAYAAPGSYVVALTVTDPQGASATSTATVTAARPNAAPTASATVKGAALRWSLDASASSDADGDALAYAWTLGDGRTASGAVVDAAYAAPGDYVVQLTVSDARGLASTWTTTVAARLPAVALSQQGEDFAHKDNGMRFADAKAQGGSAWLLWANGAMAQPFAPGAGVYHLEVVAKGDHASGWPILEARADGVVLARWTVGSSSWATYTAKVAFAQDETRTISLVFVNDLRDASGDRNVRVDAARLAPALAFEAEDLARKDNGMRYSDASAQNGAAWLLWANGAVSQPVAPGPGAWRIEVVAKADAYKGAAKMEVRADGVTIARFDVQGGAWTTFAVPTTFGTSAKTISVAFTNDARDAGGDRNLRIDVVRVVPT